jgi:hypothetical protein
MKQSTQPAMSSDTPVNAGQLDAARVRTDHAHPADTSIKVAGD